MKSAFFPGAKVVAKRQSVAAHEEGVLESRFRGDEWMVRWVDGELGVVSERNMAPYTAPEPSEASTSVLQRYVLHKQPHESMGVLFSGNKMQADHSVVNGLVVQKVHPGSAAMRAGVPEGWRVYSLNGELAQSEGVMKHPSASTVEIEVYPPGETGDTMWFLAHLEGFYRSCDPPMLAHLPDEARKWAGRKGDLRKHLASQYPSGDVSWLRGLDHPHLSSAGAPISPLALPYPDPTDVEMGGTVDGESLGFKFDPTERTWTKREMLYPVPLIVGVLFALVGFLIFSIAFIVFIPEALYFFMWACFGIPLVSVILTQKQVLIFDDARKELRYGLHRVCFLPCNPPMHSVRYHDLPSVQTLCLYIALKVHGTTVVLSVALGKTSKGEKFEAFISDRRVNA